jgi:hypothetical protein
LRQKIDEGLSCSRFGIVILSKAFLSKDWPRKELDGLIAKEIKGHKVILPIWHNLNLAEIVKQSPMLAGKFASNSNRGWDTVALEVLKAVGPSAFVTKFKTEKERKSAPLCASYISMNLNQEFSMFEIQFTKDSKRVISIESATRFVKKLLDPSMSICEILTGNKKGVAIHGRIMECNPTYTGFEKSRTFHIPIQSLVMRNAEWNEIDVEMLLRDEWSLRNIDFGFMDIIIMPRNVPAGKEHTYAPTSCDDPTEQLIRKLTPSLSPLCGLIGAMCLEDTQAEMLFEEPIWADDASYSGESG